MGLTFYPIEDDTILQKFRRHLCPFMKAIKKTTKIGSVEKGEIESICDEIICTARSNQISNQLSHDWYQYIRSPRNLTLDLEHDKLVATNLE